ncbi:hypothetical protein SAMN05192534_1103 [Alteribacillus persepolensis]|uniref:Cytochrome C and Quinol oxidase polypeptide I n=1 Tax=Alteribacillus persepolensis TaxID=568899 RepID=A0A1G8EP21_9BACI|nr:hypothetical protein [Alteribacillus persepolensis]SDH71621.1 hypothetical protein SAMN05192534_1103 [Alteribacillus persepolensis]
MQNNYSQVLLRFSAVFAVIGVVLGSHMAGAGSYAFRPIHAHILVVGWLSLFAWAVYYKVFYRGQSTLAAVHVWTAIIGSIGLTAGMWLHMAAPVELPELFTLLFYIIGGSILMISFLIFLLMTFVHKEES